MIELLFLFIDGDLKSIGIYIFFFNRFEQSIHLVDVLFFSGTGMLKGVDLQDVNHCFGAIY